MLPLGTVFCYSNSSPDDLVLMAAYPQGGYEVGASRVAPEVEDVLMTAMRDLLGVSK